MPRRHVVQIVRAHWLSRRILKLLMEWNFADAVTLAAAARFSAIKPCKVKSLVSIAVSPSGRGLIYKEIATNQTAFAAILTDATGCILTTNRPDELTFQASATMSCNQLQLPIPA
jgi:hypothetical protein